MPPDPQQNKSLLSKAFNTAGKKVTGWLYDARYGSDQGRHAEMLDRVASFPGGPEMLQLAGKLGCDISVHPRKALWGAEGDFSTGADGRMKIRVANSGRPALMALALWHELRHMQQDAGNPGVGLAGGGQLKHARTAHLMGLMGEADAYTTETLMALKMKKAGHPEYADEFLGMATRENEQGVIRRFLDKRPYESFPDDASFARALFTNMMQNGLASYRANYFSWLERALAKTPDLVSFSDTLANTEAGGVLAAPGMTGLYGPGYEGVSLRAVATAFLNTQTEDEQDTLRRIERIVRRAPRMVEQEFHELRDDIMKRSHAHFRKDPDDAYSFGPVVDRNRRELVKAAEEATAPPLRSLKTTRAGKVDTNLLS